MPSQTILANAKIVLADEVVEGSLTISDGRITAIDHGMTRATEAIDCAGDYVAPGLIELHTDNLERHITPRPKVNWPHDAAIIGHDAEMAGAGVTTVFDAIRVGSIVTGAVNRYPRYARGVADEIAALDRLGALRISHRVHLRAEVCSETLPEELAEFSAEDRVGIVSLMDHTPGQRQFRDMEKYEAYVCGKKGLSKELFDGHVKHLLALRGRLGDTHERAVLDAAKRLGATLASHDDTTPEQVETSAKHGIAVAEFPTTVDAAQACRAKEMSIVMGGPNLVRGLSHSGNVAAQTLAEMDLLDILSSDYVPSALLSGAVQLGALWGDMPRGLATVTSTPASRVDLSDRGRIAPGLRADLIRFRIIKDVPVLRGVWSEGRRVS